LITNREATVIYFAAFVSILGALLVIFSPPAPITAVLVVALLVAVWFTGRELGALQARTKAEQETPNLKTEDDQ
jgi:hypothetical protein